MEYHVVNTPRTRLVQPVTRLLVKFNRRVVADHRVEDKSWFGSGAITMLSMEATRDPTRRLVSTRLFVCLFVCLLTFVQPDGYIRWSVTN